VDVEVNDNPGQSRYEIRVSGELAGFTVYRVRPDGLAFVHTEIDDGRRGQGIASQLIGQALDDVRERGLGVLPYCPFVDAYLKRHPADVDLVPAARRAQFGL